MNFFKKIILFLPLGLFLLVSCESDVSTDKFTQGDLDFSNYVAVGNSLTAGYSDGAVYLEAQQNAYPALMAKQFAEVGGGDFNQPLVSDNLGGLVLMGNQIAETRLVLNADGGLSTAEGTPTTDVGQSIAAQGPFNNMGVPGAKSFHLLSKSYGQLAGLVATPRTANPYYVRMANDNQSVLEAAIAQNPSFFSLWIGNNDVLGYATTGGSGDVITPQAEFTQYFTALLNGLISTGAPGIVANIPNVTDIPFFNTVPTQPIPMDAATAGQVNTAYAAYNGGLDQFAGLGLITQAEADLRKIMFIEGNNYPVVMDPSLTQLQDGQGNPIPSMRQLKEGELLTLTSQTQLGKEAIPGNPQSVIGVGLPLGAEYVLTTKELAIISEAISGYNATISQVASSMDIPVADMNALFGSITQNGLYWNGTNYTVNFASGGLFSLDGVHPTQKGYAYIANQLINEINSYYSVNVPRLNIDDYPGVILP